MTINVSTILKEIGGRINVDGNVQLADTDFLGELYHFEEPIKVKGHISNTGKCLILSATCVGVMSTQCARCTKTINVPIEFEMDESLVQNNDDNSYDEDVVVFEGFEIDIDDMVADNFLMNVEGRYLCSEDCKGLCPQCGADLNVEECGCNNENIDPRWSTLIDIMNKDK